MKRARRGWVNSPSPDENTRPVRSALVESNTLDPGPHSTPGGQVLPAMWMHVALGWQSSVLTRPSGFPFSCESPPEDVRVVTGYSNGTCTINDPAGKGNPQFKGGSNRSIGKGIKESAHAFEGAISSTHGSNYEPLGYPKVINDSALPPEALGPRRTPLAVSSAYGSLRPSEWAVFFQEASPGHQLYLADVHGMVSATPPPRPTGVLLEMG